MSDDAIVLGPFRQYEIPEPMVYTFLKSDGTPEALLVGAWTSKLEWRRWAVAAVTEKTATVLDQTTLPGQVSWSWVAADMLSYGDFEGELWVGNGGTSRYRSQWFRWLITPAIGVPTV